MKSTEWKTIYTAPKDGTHILVHANLLVGRKEFQRISVAWWDKQFGVTGTSRTGHTQYKGEWTDGTVADWGMEWNQVLTPTHWMPLPEPPK